MSEVTVSQLASDVGIPVDRLLKQLSDAGVAKQAAEDVITEQEKVALLNFLRRSHGKAEKTPATATKKVALKRRTTTELKVPGAGGRVARGSRAAPKTVAVEVRRKRAVVKRDAETVESEKERALREMHDAQKALDEQKAQREEVAAQEEARRQALEDRRRQEEAERQEAEKAREEAERAATEEARRAEEEKERARREAEQKTRQEEPKRPKRMREAPAPSGGAEQRPAGRGRRRELHVANDKRGKRSKGGKRARRDVQAEDQQHGFQKPVEPKKLTIEVPVNITVAIWHNEWLSRRPR